MSIISKLWNHRIHLTKSQFVLGSFILFPLCSFLGVLFYSFYSGNSFPLLENLPFYSSLFLVFIGISGTVVTIYPILSSKKVHKKNDGDSFSDKIDSLERAATDLRYLQQFIENQKAQLEDQQNILETLKKEEDDLKPIIETQKNAVDAILKAHSSSQKSSALKNHLIGFFIGVLSSGLVSAIFMYLAS